MLPRLAAHGLSRTCSLPARMLHSSIPRRLSCLARSSSLGACLSCCMVSLSRVLPVYCPLPIYYALFYFAGSSRMSGSRTGAHVHLRSAVCGSCACALCRFVDVLPRCSSFHLYTSIFTCSFFVPPCCAAVATQAVRYSSTRPSVLPMTLT